MYHMLLVDSFIVDVVISRVMAYCRVAKLHGGDINENHIYYIYLLENAT